MREAVKAIPSPIWPAPITPNFLTSAACTSRECTSTRAELAALEADIAPREATSSARGDHGGGEVSQWREKEVYELEWKMR